MIIATGAARGSQPQPPQGPDGATERFNRPTSDARLHAQADYPTGSHSVPSSLRRSVASHSQLAIRYSSFPTIPRQVPAFHDLRLSSPPNVVNTPCTRRRCTVFTLPRWHVCTLLHVPTASPAIPAPRVSFTTPTKRRFLRPLTSQPPTPAFLGPRSPAQILFRRARIRVGLFFNHPGPPLAAPQQTLPTGGYRHLAMLATLPRRPRERAPAALQSRGP